MSKNKTYRKHVLEPGVYYSRGKDGKRQLRTVTHDDLRAISSTVKEMTKDGLLIPVPYEHDFTKQPKSSKEEFDQVAGFWADAEFDESTGRMTAIVESSGDEAEKIIGKKAKGLSIWAVGKYDAPNGKTYENAPLHLALTNKPMAVHAGKDQEWEEVSDDSFSLCMSDMVGVDPVKDVSSLREKLRKVAKIALPEVTSADELIVALMTALDQKELSEADEESVLSNPPQGAEEADIPIIMSEGDMSKELEEKIALLEKQNAELAKQLLDQKRIGIANRIDSLVMSDERFEFAKEWKTGLETKAESDLVLLDAQINALSRVPASKKPAPSASPADQFGLLMSDGSQADGQVLDNPLGSEISPEREEEIITSMLQHIS